MQHRLGKPTERSSAKLNGGQRRNKKFTFGETSRSPFFPTAFFYLGIYSANTPHRLRTSITRYGINSLNFTQTSIFLEKG